jgi:hypothetical protein
LLVFYISRLLLHKGIDLRVYQVNTVLEDKKGYVEEPGQYRGEAEDKMGYVEEPGQYRGGGEDGICRREARLNPL